MMSIAFAPDAWTAAFDALVNGPAATKLKATTLIDNVEMGGGAEAGL